MSKSLIQHYSARTQTFREVFEQQLSVVNRETIAREIDILVLTDGFDVNERDEYAMTPLHFLMDKVDTLNIETITLILGKLFEYGAQPDLQDKSGWSAVHVLMNKVKPLNRETIMSVFDVLVRHGADPNLKCSTAGSTPLHILMRRLTPLNVETISMMIDKLFEYGTQPNLQDKAGWSALHILMNKVDLLNRETIMSVFDILVRHGADINVKCATLGSTALHLLTRRLTPSNVDSITIMMGKLFEHGAQPDIQDKVGWSALHILITADPLNREAVLPAFDQLVRHGANPNVQCAMVGSTPLHILMRRLSTTNVETIMLMLDRLFQHGAQPDIQDKLGWTALHILIHRTIMSMLNEQALRHGTNQNNPMDDSFGSSSLAAEAVSIGTIMVVIDKLIDHGAIPDLQDSSGRTPFHILLSKLDLTNGETIWSVLDRLVENSMDLNVKDGKFGSTALHIVVDKVNEATDETIVAILDKLIKYGANSNLQDENGQTALHILAKKSHMGGVGGPFIGKSQFYTILRQRIDPTTIPDHDGYLPLHYMGYPSAFDPSTAFLLLQHDAGLFSHQ